MPAVKSLLQRARARIAEVRPHEERTWFRGISVCLTFIGRHQFAAVGRLRLLPTRVNGQPAAAVYLGRDGRPYRAFQLSVLTVASGKITAVTNFLGDGPVRDAGLPLIMTAEVA